MACVWWNKAQVVAGTDKVHCTSRIPCYIGAGVGCCEGRSEVHSNS